MSSSTVQTRPELTDAPSTPERRQDGFGAMETERGALPMTALAVDTTISDLAARTTLRQTFENPWDEPIEATYIFPLPSRAGVTSFEVTFGDETIRGELKERGEARQEYREAVEAGKKASIVEEDRPDVFTMRVGNLPPGEVAEVELEMTGPLAVTDGEATFRFPLVVAPRYVPGRPASRESVGTGVAVDTDAVPDASRITPPVLLPDFPNPVDLSIDVTIEPGGLDPSNLQSTFPTDTSIADDGTFRLSVRPEREGEDETDGAEAREPVRLDRDFLLRFDVASEAVRAAVRFGEPDPARGRPFMLTLVPPAYEGEPRARDVVFVLDRSGSMSGWKMAAARRALGRMVDTLTARDRFQLLYFSSHCESPLGAGVLLEATDSTRVDALESLDGLEAGGGTEMLEPLERAVTLLDDGGQRERAVVLITDGQVANDDQIVGRMRNRAEECAIHTVGIDQAVNSALLRRLADLSGGRCELVESEERLDAAMDRIHRTIGSPVVTDLELEVEEGTCIGDALAPDRMPDLFEGVPARIYGRVRSDAAAHGPPIRVSGRRPDGSDWQQRVTAAEGNETTVRTMWARQHVRDLEDEYRAETHNTRARKRLEERITETSLDHGVLCRFTAFVAVDDSATVSNGEPRQVTQPVEQPAGWERQGAQAPASPAPARSASPPGESTGGSQVLYSRAVPESMDEALPDSELFQSAGRRERKGERSENRGGFRDMSSSAPSRRDRGDGARGDEGPAFDEAATYFAPEVLAGDVPGPAADVFSLGALLYEMLIGEPMFHTTDEIRGWSVTNLEADAERLGPVEELLVGMLGVESDSRLQDAEEVAETLEHAMLEGHLPIEESDLRESLFPGEGPEDSGGPMISRIGRMLRQAIDTVVGRPNPPEAVTLRELLARDRALETTDALAILQVVLRVLAPLHAHGEAYSGELDLQLGDGPPICPEVIQIGRDGEISLLGHATDASRSEPSSEVEEEAKEEAFWK